jgi:hypothetical protein
MAETGASAWQVEVMLDILRKRQQVTARDIECVIRCSVHSIHQIAAKAKISEGKLCFLRCSR